MIKFLKNFLKSFRKDLNRIDYTIDKIKLYADSHYIGLIFDKNKNFFRLNTVVDPKTKKIWKNQYYISFVIKHKFIDVFSTIKIIMTVK